MMIFIIYSYFPKQNQRSIFLVYKMIKRGKEQIANKMMLINSASDREKEFK